MQLALLDLRLARLLDASGDTRRRAAKSLGVLSLDLDLSALAVLFNLFLVGFRARLPCIMLLLLLLGRHLAQRAIHAPLPLC